MEYGPSQNHFVAVIRLTSLTGGFDLIIVKHVRPRYKDHTQLLSYQVVEPHQLRVSQHFLDQLPQWFYPLIHDQQNDSCSFQFVEKHQLPPVGPTN